MTSVPECTFCPAPAHEIGHSLCISLMEKAVYEAVFWWVCFVCKLSFQDKHYRTNKCSGCSVKCYPKAVFHHIENMMKLVAGFCLEGLHQALAIFFFFLYEDCNYQKFSFLLRPRLGVGKNENLWAVNCLRETSRMNRIMGSAGWKDRESKLLGFFHLLHIL